VAGRPLLRGVSFRLERRDRMTIAGRNGAGKTTLLRMLAGETPIDSGELSLAKGTRLALHDQRPPRERSLTLRDYVLSGCTEAVALEAKLTELERKMGEGDQRAVYFPPIVRLLQLVHNVSPRAGDALLRRLRGGTAAPRRD
jgi:ATP-binding cassette subfamily F protein 3